ncbi:MAG: glycoside hydrolase family 15 protein [Bacillota bacterium]
MPREIVLGNGNILVNLDKSLNIRDFYYPFVGMENHVMGHKCALGIWIDGCFFWINEGSWEINTRYRPSSLVGDSMARQNEAGLELRVYDAVHYEKNIYLRKILVCNLYNCRRDLRLFFHNDFSLGGSDVGDTALYDPNTGTLLHYKRNYYFLFNGRCREQGFSQFTTGIKRFGHQEGTWRDAEDGWLANHPVAQGSVDSTAGFRLELAPEGREVIYYWIIAGRSLKEVRENNHYVLTYGPGALLKATEKYWYNWAHKHKRNFAGLPPEIEELYYSSLLVIRTQIDNRGAVLAANDTDIMVTNRDHYSYLWPRDGALVACALDRAGYPEVTRPFYYLCRDILSEEGFFWPKYNPDGSVGSSWHPWIKGEFGYLPIQEDETALVLWALGHNYELYKGFEFIKSLYSPLIIPAADFLERYRDSRTGLPLQSYDLWEERRGIFTFTAAAVYGGLRAAVYFARLFGDEVRAGRWELAARQLKAAICKLLYSYDLDRFIRGGGFNAEGELEKDFTLESSLYGVFAFGVLPAGHPRVKRTMQAVRKFLWVNTDIGGIARYPGDYYFRRSADVQKVPGNPWFICTLWLAEWYIEAARSLEELQPARELLAWAAKRSSRSGIMSEQVHPYTGEQLSVAPLTWSHAAFVLAVLKFIEKYSLLG